MRLACLSPETVQHEISAIHHEILSIYFIDSEECAANIHEIENVEPISHPYICKPV